MNPTIRYIKHIIEPYTLEEGRPLNQFKIDIKWIGPHPIQENVALWIHRDNLFVLHNYSEKQGAIPNNYKLIDHSKYNYSWMIVNNTQYSWEDTFKTSDNLEVLYLKFTIDNKEYVIDYETVKEFIELSSPFKDFNKTNYTPNIFKKEQYGTYSKK